MGVEGLIYRILGGLLGPVVFGYAMDSSCSLWNVRCDERQFCWRYDNGKLAVYLFVAVAICKSLKLVVYGFLWYFHVKEEKLLGNNETLEQKKPSSSASDVKSRNNGELESNGKAKINSKPAINAINYPLETQV